VTSSIDSERRAELVSCLAALRARLTDACTTVGRNPRSITLVAVTKGFPTSDIKILADLGVRDIGESRDQEARAKVDAVGARVRWHFVGRLQTNKARSVARYADAVHSVDRTELAAALGAGAARVQRTISAFVQVSLDGDPLRGGAPRDDLPALADAVAATEGLELAGVMAVAPLGADPRPAFAELARMAQTVRRQHPAATGISAGMSDDLEAAVEFGATHVRIGSALLGRRNATIS
jgi:pyridoxal phosphate enzyme (YggS family)